jgi:hypothetical protein
VNNVLEAVHVLEGEEKDTHHFTAQQRLNSTSGTMVEKEPALVTDVWAQLMRFVHVNGMSNAARASRPPSFRRAAASSTT